MAKFQIDIQYAGLDVETTSSTFQIFICLSFYNRRTFLWLLLVLNYIVEKIFSFEFFTLIRIKFWTMDSRNS